MSSQERRPKNRAQAAFFDLAKHHGWEITKRGWPDYFVRAGDKVAAVKVKPEAEATLTDEQMVVLRALAGCGVPTFVWSPDAGFSRVVGRGTIGGRDTSEPSGNEDGDDLAANGGKGSGGNPRGVACPRCGAEPGEPCIGARGKPRKSHHAERVSASAADSGDVIERVWAHYVACMEPRQTDLGPEERRIIRAALRVATADECCEAITQCRRSAFHMGDNKRRKKYNSLSQILRGKQGKQTTRERIDFFLDLAEKDGRSELLDSIPSESRAIFQQRLLDVQRGARLKTEDAEQRAKESEAWLREHGIGTERGEDGFPTFRRLRP